MDDSSIPSLLSSDVQGNSNLDLEDELSSFRSQWQQEIKSRSPRGQAGATDSQNDYVLEQAKVLFLKGSQLEQSGRLYEAVEFYKRATQLVPDIEFQVDFTSLHGPRERQESESSIGSVDNEELEDKLMEHLQSLQLSEDVNSRKSCHPEYDQRTTHISVLPVELLNYILRWVVSVDLDMKSLENFSEVCRGFTWLPGMRESGGQRVRRCGGQILGSVRSLGAGGTCTYNAHTSCTMVVTSASYLM